MASSYRSRDRPPDGRPRSVTLLALGVLTIGGINLLRFVQTIRQWQFLEELLPFSPLYLAASGLVWALVGLALAWGLWLGYPWAPRFTLLAALAYTLYYWLDRLLLSADRPGWNWPFLIGVNLILILLALWTLSRRRAKVFFKKA